jgi:hypothetical protein
MPRLEREAHAEKRERQELARYQLGAKGGDVHAVAELAIEGQGGLGHEREQGGVADGERREVGLHRVEQRLDLLPVLGVCAQQVTVHNTHTTRTRA